MFFVSVNKYLLVKIEILYILHCSSFSYKNLNK